MSVKVDEKWQEAYEAASDDEKLRLGREGAPARVYFDSKPNEPLPLINNEV